MQLIEWFDKYEKKLKGNPLEEIFVKNIFYPEFGNEGLSRLEPQFHQHNRVDGDNYYYDFIFKTENRNWIIETDGLYAHSETTTHVDYYHRLQVKQNWLMMNHNQEYPLIRFDSAYLRDPQKVFENRFYLRRALISDEDAFRHWYAKREGYEPNEIQKVTLEKLAKSRTGDINKGIVIYPTGLGKTYLSAFDVEIYNPSKLLFILHVKELLKQTHGKFEDILADKSDANAFFENSGFFFDGNKDTNRKYVFASIQSLSKEKNLELFKPDEFDYIIIDETHHSAANTYQKVIQHFNPKFFLGLTATPDRHDKKEILSSYSNNIFHEVTREEAIKKGFLVTSRYLGFTDNVDYSNIKFNGFKYDVNDLNKALMVEKRDDLIFEKFSKHCLDKKTLGFCVSILHAERMTKLFNERGIKSVAIHSKSNNLGDESNSLLDKFKEGEYQVAFVVDMLNEGISINDVECLMFLRPTESKTIFEQQYGRGLRVANNKERVIVLDFIGNHKTADFIKSYFKIGDVGFGQGEHKESPIEEKMVYYYDNNGNEIHFEEEVLKHIERLEIEKKDKPNIENIKPDWLEYSEYINEASSKENNLYIKMGRFNRKIETQYEVLKILKNNFGISDDDLKEKINQLGVQNMAGGYRALFISKLLGFLSKRPIQDGLTENGKKLIETNDQKLIEETVMRQMEKFLYWNDISGTVNRYNPGETNFHVFGIYPYLFLELIVYELRKYDESFDYITEDEIEFFIKFSRNMDEYKKISEMINRYRNENQQRDLELLFKDKIVDSDSRFFEVIKEMKPLHTKSTDKKIIFDESFFEIKASEFEFIKDLIEKEELILFETSPELYKKFLYSEYSIFDFHKNYLASS